MGTSDSINRARSTPLISYATGEVTLWLDQDAEADIRDRILDFDLDLPLRAMSDPAVDVMSDMGFELYSEEGVTNSVSTRTLTFTFDGEWSTTHVSLIHFLATCGAGVEAYMTVTTNTDLDEPYEWQFEAGLGEGADD
jgi:hypothetical protein